MYYRLTDRYALRAWKYVSGAMFDRFAPGLIRMDDAAFSLLSQCDGEHEFADSEGLRYLASQGIIEPCEKGDGLSEWSRFRRYEHRCVPSMNLMLTGRCNYNCLHCFNAADNSERAEEWDFDALLTLLDQAADCGIHAISLTGGEPMLHPRFDDVVRAICERGMVLEKLTTNGSLLTEDTLAMFRELHAFPEIKISFDGIGHHDRMRGRKGAEEDALRAFRLCADKGFRSFAQTQVFRDNLDSMYDTLCLLEDTGVNTTRIIRTTETRRWLKNSPQGSLPYEQYFSSMLDLAERYMREDHTMDVIMWRYLCLNPKDRAYSLIPERHKDGRDRPTEAVCVGNRTMIAVTCEGDVAPCLQMCGELTPFRTRYDSLKERSLADILREGSWLNAVCANLYALRANNTECDSCRWFGRCGGGCRALAMLHAVEEGRDPDYYGVDPLACLFFRGGWYELITERFSDYRHR